MSGNQKTAIGIFVLIMLGVFGASVYTESVAEGLLSVTVLGMTYMYYSTLRLVHGVLGEKAEAEADEAFADELMHQMWNEEKLADKYTNYLIDYFTKASLGNFTTYFRKFTCSEVVDIDGTEWTYVKYCPYNHPFLFIPCFVKENCIVITIHHNVAAIEKHLKDFTKAELEREEPLDLADDVDILDEISDYIVKIHKNT